MDYKGHAGLDPACVGAVGTLCKNKQEMSARMHVL